MTNLPSRFSSRTATSNSNISPEALTSKDLAWSIASAADDKKAAEIVLLNVANVSYLADYFVIVTGFSRTQLKAISDEVETQIAERYHRLPERSSGKSEGGWLVQDYGDVIVHIFLPDEREYYNLETFWGHAERIEYQESS
jgi:ribosome-associated protein